jgi:hypothetical protein
VEAGLFHTSVAATITCVRGLWAHERGGAPTTR